MIKITAQLILLLLATVAAGQRAGSCKRVSCHVEPSYSDYTDFFVKHCPDPFKFNGYCSCDDGPGYPARYHECPSGTFFDGYGQQCRHSATYEGFSTDKFNFCIDSWLNDRSKAQAKIECEK